MIATIGHDKAAGSPSAKEISMVPSDSLVESLHVLFIFYLCPALVTVLQGMTWKQMAVIERGAMFGFSAFTTSARLTDTTVIVNGSNAVLLKIPPPLPQPPGKEVISELCEFAAKLARQEADDVAAFLLRERTRPVSQMINSHFKASL